MQDGRVFVQVETISRRTSNILSAIMRFREKKQLDYGAEGQEEMKDTPPKFVGLRDRITHFTW